jgi:DNA polymerase III epsilon subunit
MAYVIFDTETTGFTPQTGDRIIEIAAVRVHNGVITEETFDELINPHRPIPMASFRVHGISNEMLVGAPEASEVIPRFLNFVGQDTLVAHNAEFDMAFLHHEMQLLGLDPAILPSNICTVKMARKELPDLPRHNLDALTKHFGINVEQRHRALGDVVATAELFLKIHQEEPTLF